VRLLEGYPFDAVEVDTVVVGQDTADPGAGGRGERADADALALEIGGRHRPLAGVVDRIGMLEAADHRRGQQRQRLAVRLGEQIGHDRHFRDVVLVVPDHALESVPDRNDFGELEIQAVRAQRAGFQRRGVRIGPDQRLQRLSAAATHRRAISPSGSDKA
jgi:hypothetical protein